MKIDNIDIDATLSKVERLLEEDKTISPALASMINVLLILVKLLTNQAELNSTNSSTNPTVGALGEPPSTNNKTIKPTQKNRARKPAANPDMTALKRMSGHQ